MSFWPVIVSIQSLAVAVHISKINVEEKDNHHLDLNNSYNSGFSHFNLFKEKLFSSIWEFASDKAVVC